MSKFDLKCQDLLLGNLEFSEGPRRRMMEWMKLMQWMKKMKVTVSQHPKKGQANTANANKLPETNEEQDKHGNNKVGW